MSDEGPLNDDVKLHDPKEKNTFTRWCEGKGYEQLASPMLLWYVERYPDRLFRREGRVIYRMERTKWHLNWRPIRLSKWAKSFLSLSAHYGNPSLTGYQWAAICRGIYRSGHQSGHPWVPGATVVAALSRWTSRLPTWTGGTPSPPQIVSYTPSRSGTISHRDLELLSS